ncbi:MAG: hypothetical protein M1598_05190 [Actinobacteria bacterium]|nr:hypothetical protein [Actinomycetota bacterium]
MAVGLVSISIRESLINEALHQMNLAFAGLPEDYFRDKNALTFLFNNIERVYARKPPLPELTKERVYDILGELMADSRQAGLYAGVPWCG